jgi:hypothetical protein
LQLVLKLFLPQAMLEEWAADGRVDLRDGKLFVGAENAFWQVTPAVHFLKLVSGTDQRKLVASVKTPAQLEQLGAEQMLGSVIVGEDAYDVVQGYVAEISVSSDGKKTEGPADADLLAAFLLDKMT